jgi:hypothetical protein
MYFVAKNLFNFSGQFIRYPEIEPDVVTILCFILCFYITVGRKNYLFCGNHDAAENAAIMYSLFETCKAQDIDAREWLTDVLSGLPAYNNDYRLDLTDLLPHNWKKVKQCQPMSN